MIRTQDAPSLPGILPWHSADPAGPLYLMKDGSLGMAWRLEPPETEVAPESALGALSGRYETFLKLLPTGSAAQFLCSSRRNASSRTRPWAAATTRGGILADLASARAAATERIALVHEGVPIRARTFETLFTLRVWPAWPSGDWAGRYGVERARLLETAGALESLLLQCGVRARRLDAEWLVARLNEILNPGRPAPAAARPDRLLADQVAWTPWKIDGGLVHVGPNRLRLLSAADLPRETCAGMLQRGRPAPLDVAGEGTFVLNLECRDPESVKRFLGAKKRLAFCQMSGGSDGRADLGAIKAEVDGVLARITVDGARPYSARIHLVLEEDARDATAAAIHAMSRVGLEMVEEDGLAPTLLLQTLPLAYDPSNDRSLKRGRTMLGENLAHLLPLYGAFQGTPRPDLLLLNRRGEPITFSFFDSEVAPHGIIAGVSGSGKSVLANSLILSVLRRDAHVFVLDRGNSYRKLCDLLGGTYVAFEPTKPISINPCGVGLDEDKLLFLTDIVSEMTTQGQREATVKERGLISRAVRRAFEGPEREVMLSEIREALLRDGEPAARDLGLALETFCGGGPYAGFFDRPCRVDFERAPVVFELGEIAKRRDVASVLLMALIHNITEFCRGRLSTEKYLLVDEAWTLLRSATTASFLEDVLRTYRKLNAAAVMITQQVSDFEGRTGEAIRANAPNRIFLRQTSETVQAMERLLDLSPEEKELLGSVTTVKGLFSEMLVLAGAAKGVARLSPDPLSYWLTTSDARDNALLAERVARHREKGAADPVRTALQELALWKPHGAESRHE